MKNRTRKRRKPNFLFLSRHFFVWNNFLLLKYLSIASSEVKNISGCCASKGMRGNILRALYRSLKPLKRQHKILKVVVEWWWEIERELHCNAVAQFVKLRPQFVPTVVWEKSGNALKIDFKQNFLSFLIKVVWWPQISVYMWLIMSEKSH